MPCMYVAYHAEGYSEHGYQHDSASRFEHAPEHVEKPTCATPMAPARRVARPKPQRIRDKNGADEEAVSGYRDRG
jgi:hypothetical protein